MARRQNIPEYDDRYVTVGLLDARIDAIKSELRWQRWLLFALAAMMLSARLPELPAGPPVGLSFAPSTVELALTVLHAAT